MKRFRISKLKSWKRAELAELRDLVDTKSNAELCEHFNISTETLRNTMQKHQIKRSEEVLEQMRADAMTGEKNPNWKLGISKDGARYSAIQRRRYPERKHARDAVYRALKEQRIIKPLVCEDCKELKKLAGHHEDYLPENWLKVIWVCRKCHRIRHEGLH